MGFFAFLGRHLGAAIIGAVGLVLAALGFADQADAIMTAFEPWQLQALGAAIFVTAVIMVLYAFDKEQRARIAGFEPKSPQQSVPNPPKPSVTPATTIADQTASRADPPSQPAGKDGRVYVEAHQTPEKLSDMCEGKTTHQARRATEPFIGKWMRVSGVVDDVAFITDELANVRFRRQSQTLYKGFTIPDTRDVKLRFRTQLERLEMLQGGEHMVVDGQIEEIHNFGITLANCEIVSVSDAPSA